MINGTALTKAPLCCPKCGKELDIELLEVELESSDERIFSLSCSSGDYRAVASEARVNQAIADAMLAYLKCPSPNQRRFGH